MDCAAKIIGCGLVALWTCVSWAGEKDTERWTALDRLPEVKQQPVSVSGKGRVTPKVIGGSKSAAEYPWMTALVTASETDLYQGQFCGGMLVHPSWVLTAAHCVFDREPSTVDVVVGVTDLDSPAGSERRSVVEILVHAEYSDYSLNHDIALLRLDQPVTNFPTLLIVDDPALVAPATRGRVIGWGSTDTGGSVYPADLQEGVITLVARTFANAQPAFDGLISSYMLPAGLSFGDVSTCSGDSGGPLLVRANESSDWRVVGLTSFGIGTCGDNYGIYTDVISHRDWILDRILPDYAAWEQREGVMGEVQSSAGALHDHWTQFAFGQPADGLTPGTLPALRPDSVPGQWLLDLHRSAGMADVEYVTFWSTNPNVMAAPLGSNDTTGVIVPAGDLERLTEDLGALSGSNLFFSVQAQRRASVSNRVRDLNVPGSIHHAVQASDMPAWRRYRLQGLPLASTHRVTARSEDFNVTLELLNASGSVLASSSNGNAGGTDERINLTGASGNAVYAQVRAATPGAEGIFELNVHPVNYSLPAISVGGSVNGSLTGGDPADEWWLPQTFYTEDYKLVPPYPADQDLRFSVTSGLFSPDVYVIDGETGRPLFTVPRPVKSEMVWRPHPNKQYVLRVSTADQMETGSFTASLNAVVGNEEIAAGSSKSGALSSSLPTDPNYSGTYYYQDYDLTAIDAGLGLRISLSSPTFNTFLQVLNADESEVLYTRDDAWDTTDSLLEFNPGSADPLVIRVSSAVESAVGGFLLTVTKVTKVPELNKGSGLSIGYLLNTDDRDPAYSGSYYKDDYVLTGITPGQSVTVDLGSNYFDTFLEIVNAQSNEILYTDDDGWSGTNSRIVFTPAAGVEYWVRVTTAGQNIVGGYSVLAY